MKFQIILVTFCLLCLDLSNGSDFNCDAAQLFSSNVQNPSTTQAPVCFVRNCADRIRNHISEELNAAFYYLYLAAYFDQDSVNRPGLAKFLYESASEEREHAISMLDYLNLRGIPFTHAYSINQNEIKVPNEISYRQTLEMALKIEVVVTKAIHNVIEVCADDFHSADVFTNPILDEQHNGIRKLQGLIKTFDSMTLGYSDKNDLALAEYLFDKKEI